MLQAALPILLALRDRDGRNQLSSPLQLERYRDRGEFWDAWDLAADYRSQPLGVISMDVVEWLDQGPLVAHLVLRRQLENADWLGSRGLDDLFKNASGTVPALLRHVEREGHERSLQLEDRTPRDCCFLHGACPGRQRLAP